MERINDAFAIGLVMAYVAVGSVLAAGVITYSVICWTIWPEYPDKA